MITVVENKQTEVNFPALYKFVGNGACQGKTFIVMFTSCKQGVVVHVDKNYTGGRKVGHVDDTLISCEDTDTWKKFTGKITLQN